MKKKSKSKLPISKKKPSKFFKLIAEIMGNLEERRLDNDWLFNEIRKKQLKISLEPTQNRFQILENCPDYFIKELHEKLLENSFETFDNVTSFTKTYHWFFTDVVSGADPTVLTKNQVKKINVLNQLIRKTSIFHNRDVENIVILSTGDGAAIGFADSVEKPFHLAIELHKLILIYNKMKRGKDKILIRIGIDSGPVYFMNDLTGKENFWGPGIIMARRVMDLAGPMQIFSSQKITNDMIKLSSEYKEIFHPIGEYIIKHNEQIKIYNVYGNSFGNKNIPRKSKVIQKQINAFESSKNSFRFNKVSIDLSILDTDTMLTHHTWKWNLINTSKDPKDEIFYFIDGDVSKDFSKLNVKVTDEDDNNLNILGLDVNKPLHKEFKIKLKKPIKPKQKNRIVTLEYDWEEPERNFLYKLPTNCKEFRYSLSIPNSVDIKPRVLQVDTDMGYKWHATPHPIIDYGDTENTISWTGINLEAHTAYKLEW